MGVRTLDIAVVEYRYAVVGDGLGGKFSGFNSGLSIDDHDVEFAFNLERKLATDEPHVRARRKFPREHLAEGRVLFHPDQALDPGGEPFGRLPASEFEHRGIAKMGFDRNEEVKGRIGEHRASEPPSYRRLSRARCS